MTAILPAHLISPHLPSIGPPPLLLSPPSPPSPTTTIITLRNISPTPENYAAATKQKRIFKSTQERGIFYTINNETHKDPRLTIAINNITIT